MCRVQREPKEAAGVAIGTAFECVRPEQRKPDTGVLYLIREDSRSAELFDNSIRQNAVQVNAMSLFQSRVVFPSRSPRVNPVSRSILFNTYEESDLVQLVHFSPMPAV